MYIYTHTQIEFWPLSISATVDYRSLWIEGVGEYTNEPQMHRSEDYIELFVWRFGVAYTISDCIQHFVEKLFTSMHLCLSLDGLS